MIVVCLLCDVSLGSIGWLGWSVVLMMGGIHEVRMRVICI